MTYLDFPKMLGNYWKKPVNVYEQAGTVGDDDHPAEEAVKNRSILRDALIWLLWAAIAIAGIGIMLLLRGSYLGELDAKPETVRSLSCAVQEWAGRTHLGDRPEFLAVSVNPSESAQAPATLTRWQVPLVKMM